MYIDSQRLGFKISPLDQRYHNKIQKSLAHSRQSFTGVQTPGWSSLVKSQLSDNTKKHQITERSEPMKESDILKKLNKLGNVKLTEIEMKKDSANQKVDKNQTIDTNQTRNRGYYNSRNKEISRVQSSSHLKSHSRAKIQQKRWNQISVHEHLYLESRKLENKRMIEKVLDEEFKKKQIFRFHPTINPKSSQLAEIKFSRIQSKKQFQKQDDSKNQITNSLDSKQKQCKEIQRYRILNRTFYYLTQQNTILDQEIIKQTLQELPLPCIQCLQPIIQGLYQGKSLQWVDFLQSFNDKRVKQKESFFKLMEKWFIRRDKISNS